MTAVIPDADPPGRLPGALVISSGRCGSTLVSDVLCRHPDVLSVSELFSCIGTDAFAPAVASGEEILDLLMRPLVGPTFLVRHHLEMDEYTYPFDGSGRFTRLTGVPPVSLTTLPHLTSDPDGLLDEVEGFLRPRERQPAAHHYRALFEHLARRFGRRLWVERSGGSSGHAEQLLRWFPDARVVHLYRDGPATARSMSRHPGMRLTMLGGDLARRTGVDPYSRRVGEEVPCPDEGVRHLWPDRFSPEAFLAHPLPVERFGTVWSLLVGRGARALSRLSSEQLLHVSYDSLVSEPQAVAATLARFLDLPAPAHWLSQVGGLVRERSAGAAEVSAELARACRPGEDRLRRLLGLPLPEATAGSV